MLTEAVLANVVGTELHAPCSMSDFACRNLIRVFAMQTVLGASEADVKPFHIFSNICGQSLDREVIERCLCDQGLNKTSQELDELSNQQGDTFTGTGLSPVSPITPFVEGRVSK